MELIRRDETLRVTRRALMSFPDFRRVMVGQFISQASDALMLIVLAKSLLFTDSDGPTPALLAQAALCGAIPLVFAGPLGGFLADRWPRKQILVSGQAGRALIALAAALCIMTDAHLALMAVFVCSLCLTRVLFTARAASIRHLVRQHELVAADSLMLIVGVLAGSIGALAFGASRLLGAPLQLALVALSHFIGAYIFDRTRVWLGGDGRASSRHWSDITRQLSCGKTRYAVLSTSVHRLLVGTTVATVALDVDGRTGGAASGYAVTLGVAGLGTFVGSVSAEWVNERITRRAATIGAFVLAGCFVSPLPAIPGASGRLIAVGVVAFLFQNLRIASDATIQANAAPGSCGRVFAVYDIAFNLMYVGGLLAGLAIATNATIQFSLGFIGPLYLLGGVVFALLRRDDFGNAIEVPSPRLAPNDILADDAPTDQRECVEDRGDHDERARRAAVPGEVA